MVQDYRYMIAQYSQTSLRDVIGQMTLDQLLTEREEIAKAIEQHVEKDTKGWGVDVTGLRIQDIDMPEELKKMMSRQASAEREKRATITKAEGDKEAAMNLSLAAKTMAASPGAMQLRTLQTIDGLGPTASNTVVLAVPIEILESRDVAQGRLSGQFRQRSIDGAVGVKNEGLDCAGHSPGAARPSAGETGDLPRRSRVGGPPVLRCAVDHRRLEPDPREPAKRHVEAAAPAGPVVVCRVQPEHCRQCDRRGDQSRVRPHC